MKCDVCQKRGATIHLQEVVNGVHKALHLCNVCATEQTIGDGLLKDLSLSDILTGLAEISGDIGTDDPASQPDITCPGCGLTTGDFQTTGHLGCPDCYTAFAPIVKTILPDLDTARHAGTIPGHHNPTPPPPTEPGRQAARFQIDLLQRELNDAVAAEYYERAASLRDEIHRLQALADEPS